MATEKAYLVGSNLTVTVSDTSVTITLDPRTDLGLSKEGKSRLVASTRGNVTLANGITLSVNAYRRT
jgi:hypothetical protein